ncbi:LiaF transmembrane domain-containing protein [Pseudobutyrivibrio xylanivorans]|uniref:LiaF transmembrane domain-containing protein n=1 Tax=Pseudobutyrivibrio xylanivorans TaxID=185007 RepID=A0A5P6VQF2_PSEXY|nr:hypothetical protein [Pseudobutyrivibrio xylanivorans]QFJ54905.1 hypothetical protein FXF36_08555 [Pseudobutyrivibrio xylanivorans]
MTKSKIKNIVRGLAIIVFAVCLLLSKNNSFNDYPMIKIGMCVILALILVEQLIEKSWVGVFFPLGVGACLFQNELGLGGIHFAVIILAFVLIGVGFSMIFGKKPAHINIIHDGDEHKLEIGGNSEYWEEDGNFDLDNSLGSKTQYLTINNMKKGTIDNALGQMTVYFNGTTVDPDGAFLDIDNGMGSLAIYFPKEFRVSFNCDNGMGKINMHGEGSQDLNQPLIKADVDNGMGQIDFYFE